MDRFDKRGILVHHFHHKSRLPSYRIAMTARNQATTTPSAHLAPLYARNVDLLVADVSVADAARVMGVPAPPLYYRMQAVRRNHDRGQHTNNHQQQHNRDIALQYLARRALGLLGPGHPRPNKTLWFGDDARSAQSYRRIIAMLSDATCTIVACVYIFSLQRP